ncbi:MAG TPA: M13 family metallopeptidase, partial [Polyangiaceae bacterium]|nr:M13 family metallopeptidase [Polyangiaceae bacterium]
KRQRERWKRCVSATDEALGDALGRLYVERHFGGSARDDAQRMAVAVSEAFAARAAELPWMDADTRARALRKRERMLYLIGYPERFKAYDFAVDRRAFAANQLAARAHEVRRKLSKVGTTADRGEWVLSPPTVNAYYEPLMNHMAFPAGILQAPFYDPRAADVVNFGAVGMIVGHELTHGFDDEGSQYDEAGNLADWWRPETRRRFDEKGRCLAAQYDAYETLPGVKLNGKLTLGENIADLGGAKLAFRAYRARRAGAPERLVADGYEEDQLFFIALGQAWCGKTSDEFARMLAQVDPHSPARFRVNGPLANLPEFARAFACPAGAPMAPVNRCEIW